MKTGNNYSGTRRAFGQARVAGKRCNASWRGWGVAVTCGRPFGHDDLHHGLVQDHGEGPVTVMWSRPGTDLWRTDGDGIYAVTPDV